MIIDANGIDDHNRRIVVAERRALLYSLALPASEYLVLGFAE